MGCCASTEKNIPPVLPQDASLEAQRERKRQIDQARKLYEYAYVPFPAHVATVPLKEIPVGGLETLTKVGMHLETTKADGWANYLLKFHRIYEEKKKASEGDRNANAFAEYYYIFGDLLPDVAKDDKWKTDEEFAFSHTGGMFPWFITKVDDANVLRQKFNVPDDRIARCTGGKSVEDLVRDNNLFFVDHDVLEGIPVKEGCVVVPTITLFWVDARKKLMPLAIQMGQHKDSSPVVTPQDGAPGKWLAAKIHVGCANLLVHSGYLHAFEMHFLMETFWTSCCRNLDDAHPMKQLMKPHAYNTLFVNWGIRGTLQPGGMLDVVFGCGGKGALALAQNCWNKFGYVKNLDIKQQLARRGVEHIPEFPYRDDANAFWSIHLKYITAMVDVFYRDDQAVQQDYELQDWAKDMSNERTCAVKGLPMDDAAGAMTTKGQLVSFLTCSLFNAVFSHTYLETLGLLYWGFVPMNPGSFRLPVSRFGSDEVNDITDAEIVSNLPSVDDAILQNALSWSIHEVNPNEHFLLQWLPKNFLEGGPTQTSAICDTWHKELAVENEAMINKGRFKSCPPNMWISIIH